MEGTAGNEVKPAIKKVEGRWCLMYKYPARQFWLFGANSEERKAIQDRCISVLDFETWSKAVSHLRILYRDRMVVTR
jgi:hypothetical protein